MPFLSSDSLEERLARVPTTDTLPAGMWDNFWSGAGKHAMRSFATVGRAIDLAGAVGPMVVDYFRGGTELQDQYFQEHDEIFNSAVDYWTPKPNEVGMAGQVVGSLVGMLPVILGSPHLAVGATVLNSAEDLTRQGVSPGRAVGVGIAQGVGLGVGIWMPTIGSNLLERALVGGAGANVLQGIATREASSLILSGTKEAKQFGAFDPEQLTTDALLGLAFGVWTHVNPDGRIQSKEAWDRIATWAKNWKPSQKDALMALRQAQHINADSMPGKPQDLGDIERHVAKIRQSIDQLARDKPVVVEDLPAAHVNPDPERQAAAEKQLQDMAGIAEKVAKDEGLSSIPRAKKLSAEDRAIEGRFASQVEGDVPGAIAEYRKRFGNVINTDNARELSPDYLKDRTKSAAVHEPASYLAKEVYKQMLTEPAQEGQTNTVVFTAGGTGAGKSTGMEMFEDAQRAQIVYDTNMNGYESSKSKIEQALAAGKGVDIFYTFRDPVEALQKGALTRAMRMKAQLGSGRTVPLTEHAKTHVSARATMERLAVEYAGDPRVKIEVVDNSFGKGNAKVVMLNDLPKLEYDSTYAALQQKLDAEFQAGNISEDVYRAFKGTGTPSDRGGPEVGRQPKPPGSGAGRAGQGEGLDPLTAEAQRLAQQYPDLKIPLGDDVEPVSVRDFLKQADDMVAQAEADVGLFETAARCLLGA